MIFFLFSKVRRFFSLKEAISDPKCKTKKLHIAFNFLKGWRFFSLKEAKCKTKKLNIALNFHNQKSLRRYDDSVRRNLIFCRGGRKFFMSILWRKKLTISISLFSSPRPQFVCQFWFSVLISLKNCPYLMCVKAEKFSWLLRVARAKTIWGAVYPPHPTPNRISWQAMPREKVNM